MLRTTVTTEAEKLQYLYDRKYAGLHVQEIVFLADSQNTLESLHSVVQRYRLSDTWRSVTGHSNPARIECVAIPRPSAALLKHYESKKIIGSRNIVVVVDTNPENYEAPQIMRCAWRLAKKLASGRIYADNIIFYYQSDDLHEFKRSGPAGQRFLTRSSHGLCDPYTDPIYGFRESLRSESFLESLAGEPFVDPDRMMYVYNVFVAHSVIPIWERKASPPYTIADYLCTSRAVRLFTSPFVLYYWELPKTRQRQLLVKIPQREAKEVKWGVRIVEKVDDITGPNKDIIVPRCIVIGEPVPGVKKTGRLKRAFRSKTFIRNIQYQQLNVICGNGVNKQPPPTTSSSAWLPDFKTGDVFNRCVKYDKDDKQFFHAKFLMVTPTEPEFTPNPTKLDGELDKVIKEIRNALPMDRNVPIVVVLEKCPYLAKLAGMIALYCKMHGLLLSNWSADSTRPNMRIPRNELMRSPYVPLASLLHTSLHVDDSYRIRFLDYFPHPSFVAIFYDPFNRAISLKQQVITLKEGKPYTIDSPIPGIINELDGKKSKKDAFVIDLTSKPVTLKNEHKNVYSVINNGVYTDDKRNEIKQRIFQLDNKHEDNATYVKQQVPHADNLLVHIKNHGDNTQDRFRQARSDIHRLSPLLALRLAFVYLGT